MDNKSKGTKQDLEGESLGVVTPTEPVEKGDADNKAAVIENSPAKDDSGETKKSIVKRIIESRNLYFGIFLALVLIVALMIVVAIKWNNKNSNKNGAATSTLSTSDLSKLSATTTVVGDSKQTLDVQSSAIFDGQILARGDINAAGSLKVGGTLSAQSANFGTGSYSKLQVNDTLSVSGTTSFGQLSVQKNLTVAGSGSFGSLSASQLSVGTLQFTGDLTISKHIATSGGVPSKTNGGALGAGGTVSVNGSDTAGTVSINTGGGPPAGCFVTVNFATKYSSTPHVVISPSNSSAASISYYANRSNTGFSICSNTAPSGGANYIYDYIVLN